MQANFRKYSDLVKEAKQSGGVTNFINNLTERGHIVTVGKFEYSKEFGELRVRTL
jgi:hypothetical protein